MKFSIYDSARADLFNLIPTGKDNKITASTLKMLTGYTSRELKRAIARLRADGAIICSCLDSTDGGYFKPNSPEEAMDYVRTERKRIASELRALQAAEQYVKRYEASSQAVNQA